MMSPGKTSADTLSSATFEPKVLVTLRAITKGSAIVLLPFVAEQSE